MTFRMFTSEGRSMTSNTHAAMANGMADAARARVLGQCPVFSPADALWSPIYVGTETAKHGRPRRPEVSHP